MSGRVNDDGEFIYRLADGTAAIKVRRTPAKKFRQFWWSTELNGWESGLGPFKGSRDLPLFGLDELTANTELPIVVHEGEGKCLLAIEHWPGMLHTSILGGSNKVAYADLSVFKNREIWILADADKAGHAFADKMADLASKAGALSIKVCKPIGFEMEKQPDGKIKEIGNQYHKWDFVDWWEHSGADFKTFIDLDEIDFKEWSVKEPDIEEKPQKTTMGLIEEKNDFDGRCLLHSNDHYKILGMIDDRIAIYLFDERNYRAIAKSEMQKKSTLISIAPLNFWCSENDCDYIMSDRGAVVRFSNAIIQIARKIGQINIDNVFGIGAMPIYRDGNVTVGWNLGDRAVINGKEYDYRRLNFKGGQPGKDSNMLVGSPGVILEKTCAESVKYQFREILMRYPWRNEIDGMRMCGWIATALLCGALDWRPHLYFYGERDSGKSTLLKELIQPLFGSGLYIKAVDITAAALARMIGTNAIPVIVDEAEASEPWVRALIELAKIASGGEGARIRSDSTSSTEIRVSNPRFMGLFCSTIIPAMTQAVESRFAIVSLGDKLEKSIWAELKNDIESIRDNLPGLRSLIINHANEIVELVSSVKMELRQNEDFKGGRDIEMVAVLTAGWRWFGGDGIVNTAIESAVDSPNVNMMKSIMEIEFVSNYDKGSYSVYEILDGAASEDEKRKYDELMDELETRFGIRWSKDNTLYIDIKNSRLKQHLKRAGHGAENILLTLKDLPNVKMTDYAERFKPSKRTRCLEISPQALIDSEFYFDRHSKIFNEESRAEEMERERQESDEIAEVFNDKPSRKYAW